MPTTFNGTLNTNEVFGGLFNMIISQQVYSGFLSGLKGTLAEKNRVDGSLYGDTKLYYATDVLESKPWLGDAEAGNLLAVNRPASPEVQKITLNVFRMIDITTDQYLSKRAWSTEFAFTEFVAVTLGWIRDTKRVYDITLMNAYFGTTESSVGGQAPDIDVTNAVGSATGEEAARLKALAIGRGVADILTKLQDVSRDYNDYEFVRAYALDDLMIIWNSMYFNEFRYMDLPTIFHKDGVLSEDKIEQMVLNERYFGTVNTSAIAYSSNDGSHRTLVECDYATAANQPCTHLFPGDIIPSGTYKVLSKVKTAGVWYAVTIETAANAVPAGESYDVATDVICKIVKKEDAVPFMSAFQVETTFFNQRSLTENHYLIWGHNTLEYLANYPFITAKEI